MTLHLLFNLGYNLFTAMKENNFWGYCRVSTKEQGESFSLESQKQKLKRYGVLESRIAVEIASSGPEGSLCTLDRLIDTLSSGDTIVVTHFDRFGRNTISSLIRIKRLQDKNIRFISLDFPELTISTSSATQDFIMKVLFIVAEYDYKQRRERQRIGIEAAKKITGKYPGRKSILTKRLLDKIKSNYSLHTVKDIAKLCDISVPTVYKALRMLQLNKKNNTYT